MTPFEDVSLDRLLDCSVDRLYEELGREVYPSGRSALPVETREYARAGRAWLMSRRDALAAVICPNTVVKALLRDDGAKRAILVAKVFDLVASLHWGVSPATVAVLLVKEGVNSLCHDYNEKAGPGK